MSDMNRPEDRLHYLNHKLDRMSDGLSLRYRDHIKKRNSKANAPSEASLVALAKSRKGTSLKADDGVNLRRCKHCRRVAIKEADVCWWHGGRQIKMKIREQQGLPIDTKVRAKKNRAVFLATRGLVPQGLAGHAAYRALVKQIYEDKSEDVTWKDHFARRTAAGVLLHELIVGYTQLEIDPSNTDPWLRALEKCREANFI